MYGAKAERKGVMWAQERERERDKCDIAPREVGGMGSPRAERQLLLSLQRVPLNRSAVLAAKN